MTKPVITTRATKGSALTWTEGDTNLENLRDATITVKADTGGTDVVSDLNGTVTLVAGTNVTITGDNTAKTVTINSTASGGATTLDELSDVVITAAATNDILRFDGTNWVDTAASSLTVGTASVGSTVTLTADNTTNATEYPLFSSTATGNVSPRTDTGFTYNPSTGALTAATGSFTSLSATGTTTLATSLSGLLKAASGVVGTAVSGTDIKTVNSTSLIGSGNLAVGTVTSVGGTGTISGITLTGTVTSSGNLTLGGSLDLSSPPAIGATTASTGSFTGLTAKGTTNTAKLTLDTTAISSTAWTTNGIGLKAQSATYTDTSSLAGTVGGSYVHVISTPSLASTNAITVTDAATLYIGNGPNASTNTTITNKWALLTVGKIKAADFTGTIGATTPSVGYFTGAQMKSGGEVSFYNSTNTAYTAIKASESADGTFFTLPATPGSNGQVLKTDGTGVLSWVTVSSGGISNVVEDTTPQLGGDLDLVSYKITTTTVNGNILIEPNGTGDVYLRSDRVYVGDPNANCTVTTDGTGDLILNTNGGTNSGAITIFDAANGDITITPNGTGKSKISAINYNEGALYDLGTTGGTIAPNVANGNVQKITLNSALTINAFTSPVAGQSLTLIIYGGTAYTSITSTMKFAGGIKTLTGTAGCIDILSVYYDGTNYFASLGKGFA